MVAERSGSTATMRPMRSRIECATPVTVPPVPTVATKASSFWMPIDSIAASISRAVCRWASGFDGLSNWCGIQRAVDRLAGELFGGLAIAPSICRSGSVSTTSAPNASSS